MPLAIRLIRLVILLLTTPSAVHCGSHVENLGTRAGGTEPRATLSLGSGINWGFRSPGAKDTGNLRAMSDSFSMIAEIDRLCGQIAIAMHNAEFQIYATLALVVVLSFLLFPPRDDLDQV